METTVHAPPPPGPAGSALSVGEVVGRSFSIWLRNLVPFTVVTLVVNVPVFVLTVVFVQDGASWWKLALDVVSLVVNLVATGALTFAVLQSLDGSRVGVGAALGKGLSRLWVVLVVSLEYGLVVLVGVALLVVPGVIAMCALFVAVPAVVVEPLGATAALARSRALTKGSRWSILAVVLVVFVFSNLVVAASPSVVSLAASALPRPLPALLGAVITALAATLGNTAPAVAYHDLRVAKEGVDTAALVKVFE
jgi:hypothetical protein